LEKILICKNCFMPSSRPRIHFDENGVCNSCNYQKKKSLIDWAGRRSEFEKICNQHRSKNGEYDCIVPWSGGKDSSSIAYKLKYEFKMNPLLTTFSPLIPTKIGQENRELLINKGFDNYFFRPNQKISKYLSKRFFIERGNPKIHWDAGINSFPLTVALEKKINLIFYAEHGESEYGGRVLHANSDKLRDISEVLENQIGDDPSNWEDDFVTQSDLNVYKYPDVNELKNNQINAYYFSYFFKWDVYENFKYVKDKFNFKQMDERISGTFQNYDSIDDHIDPLYYYMQYIKFGFGRCLRDASRLVQNKHLERNLGINYIKKYDGEFPDKVLDKCLKYLDMSLLEFNEIIDKHRNKEIWELNGNKYKLKFNIFGD
jgi:N-acetyl sugar amidotransferase